MNPNSNSTESQSSYLNQILFLCYFLEEDLDLCVQFVLVFIKILAALATGVAKMSETERDT